MANASGTNHEPEIIDVDLRNPALAGVLAWLWPGAGHVYQRRYAKGILFMSCILGTYFFGLCLADGHVVYASVEKEDFRWQYACQLGVGMPALPALLQTYRVWHDQKPLLGGLMASPENVVASAATYADYRHDQLSQWHLQYHAYFELGTLYTMIAGLLNVLVIYDAVSGPVLYSLVQEDKKPKSPDPGRHKT